jgi:excisionase family DNA binding protein
MKNGLDNSTQELIGVDAIAAYLGVKSVTVYRWCRAGRLPCLKIGKEWRMRRAALDAFLRQSERGQSLASQLRAFLTVPDHVLGIAPTPALLRRLDAAFFQVAEAAGGVMVKSVMGETASIDELRVELTQDGVDVARLEATNRFRFVDDSDPHPRRAAALGQLLATHGDERQTLWASYNWVQDVDLDMALLLQEQLAQMVDRRQLVIKTAVLTAITDTWQPTMQRRAQVIHRGTIWLGDGRVALTRSVPLGR